MAEEIKPCPFCGEQPEIDDEGSSTEISCCASMFAQKSDYLTIDERETWNSKTYKYSDEAEKKVLDILLSAWNKRI